MHSRNICVYNNLDSIVTTFPSQVILLQVFSRLALFIFVVCVKPFFMGHSHVVNHFPNMTPRRGRISNMSRLLRFYKGSYLENWRLKILTTVLDRAPQGIFVDALGALRTLLSKCWDAEHRILPNGSVVLGGTHFNLLTTMLLRLFRMQVDDFLQPPSAPRPHGLEMNEHWDGTCLLRLSRIKITCVTNAWWGKIQPVTICNSMQMSQFIHRFDKWNWMCVFTFHLTHDKANYSFIYMTPTTDPKQWC
jgi:hypothetical protein